MGHPTKIGNSVVIQNRLETQIIHPSFNFKFDFNVENQLSNVKLIVSKGMKEIDGHFEYNSFSQFNASLWKVNNKFDQSQKLIYFNGKLSSFVLNKEEEQDVGYNSDGFVTKIGNINIAYKSDGTIETVGEESYVTNEIGWVIERGILKTKFINVYWNF